MTQIFLRRFTWDRKWWEYRWCLPDLLAWPWASGCIGKESSWMVGGIYEAAAQAYPGPVPAHLFLLGFRGSLQIQRNELFWFRF